MRVCVLGDLLLDVIVRLDSPVAQGDDTTAETRVGAGGQAANVAAWVAELGEQARFVGKRAGDAAGRLVEDELRARGVELVGPVVEGRNGVVVALVGPNGDRTMASDRGVSPQLRPEELDMRWFRECGWLHLSGYSLLRAPIDEAGAKAAGAVRALGGKVSVDLASANLVRAYGPERLLARLRLLEPDVVFANDEEVEALGDEAPGKTLVRKRGREGIVVDGEAIEAVPTEVVDSTGAGDALAAGFIVGGPQLALETAARCVRQLGAMP
jgi:sugar/nucleoside kinase (ribokinase family)